MRIKNIKHEDFVQYRKPSMFIGTAQCDFKCDKLNGCKVCQNSKLAKAPTHTIDDAAIVSAYMNNPITSAIVIGGLEPFDQLNDLFNLIAQFRLATDDDIVIYTGYNRDESVGAIEVLKQYKNIIIKWGRFIAGHQPHYDTVLGVSLASDNQYAERI